MPRFFASTAAVLLLFCSSVQAQVLPKGIKGIQLGMTKAQVFDRVKALTQGMSGVRPMKCETKPHPTLPYLNCFLVEGMTYANVPVVFAEFKFKADVLHSVELTAELILEPELAEQRGRISTAVSQLITSRPLVEPTALTWKDEKSSLIVMKGHLSDTPANVVAYYTKEYMVDVMRALKGTGAEKLDL